MRSSGTAAIFFQMKKWLDSLWIPEFGMDNGFRESVHDEAPTFKFYHAYFLSDILVVSYILSCAEPAVNTRRSAYTTEADATRRQNGFAIPLKASTRGVIPPTWGRNT